MVATLEYTAPSYAIVKRWARKGHLEDEDRCGQPTTTKTGENIAHVHEVVMDYRRFTVNQRANTTGTCNERVENTLHNELGMSEVSARLVPRHLTPDQKLTRLIRLVQILQE